MRRALELAARGAGQVAPNPKVGAVVVQGGEIVGEGWHRRFGEAHAEVNALAAAGSRARGATIYVTLEPCNHHGKTPPCTAALIAAGVSRVVVAVGDPNPLATGGAAALRAHGIVVDEGVLHDEGGELNAPFLFGARGAQRPFVTLKLALSADGAIAPVPRERVQLTGVESMRDVHRMRADADAIAVGVETALVDDPALTVRDGEPPRVSPTRVVFDRTLRLPIVSALVRTAREAPVLVLTGPDPAPDRVTALEAAGVTVLRTDGLAGGLTALRDRGVHHLLVEGGAALARAFLETGAVDRLITFQSPVRLGDDALKVWEGIGPPGRWTVVSQERRGDDTRTVYRRSA